MSDPASRRRRPSSPPPARRGGGSGGGPLPTAALAIGVVIAGLGIGALISAFQNRGTLPQLGATSVPAVTPVPQPSPPSPLPTLAPAPSPSPTPSATPAPVRTAAPSPAPSRAATAPPATASPAAVPTAALPSLPPAALPAPSAHPVPTLKATPAAVVPAADPGIALVRRYLQSLIAGDEASAYAALGGTSSDRNLDLKEEAFLGKDARITSMRVSRADASGETIDADITSGSGSYVATYRVTNGPGGPTITQHDFIKV